MQQTVPKASESPSRIDRMVRVINPRVMKLAGGRWFPTLSVLHHRGHKSGRMYATPVSALPRDDYFWFNRKGAAPPPHALRPAHHRRHQGHSHAEDGGRLTVSSIASP
jgi:hypothetical protein